MNNLTANFDRILELAKKQGVPLKKRGVLREYLQSKFLVELYGLKESEKLSFVGGTGLRMLYGLPRFSEDLDFDNLGVSDERMEKVVKQGVESLERENVDVELKVNIREDKKYFELRFPDILYELGVSSNPREKLMIKVDYSRFWKGQGLTAVLFARYGLVEQVVTNPLDQFLVQKLAAYVGRNRVQPRDMYDIVWLYAHQARLDEEFMKVNGKQKILEEAKLRFKERGVKPADKKRLRPFLFEEGGVNKLDMLGEVLEEL